VTRPATRLAGLAALTAGAALAGTAPRWLPSRVVALRGAIFTLVNGPEGIPVLDRPHGADDFLRVYADPAAGGRSHGAGLSDLFWYWLAPGPEVHQEHLEPGPRYDQAARVTRAVLASRTKAEWAELTARCAARVLDEPDPPQGKGLGAVRLRDLMMPVWAEVFYELVFRAACPPRARELIVANADDVVSALKCTRLRHMGRRARLTRYLRDRIDAGDVPFALPGLMSPAEQAFYLQGTFFNTAVVQMSEAMAHLLLAIAQHPAAQDRLRARPGDDAYLGAVVNEAMRVWPLFGVAHRITTADIAADPPIPAGSVVLFDYLGFQHGGDPDTARFDPGRWADDGARALPFIPFGVSANRPCPARGIAPVALMAATRQVLGRYALASGAAHTRSLANRAPALLLPPGTRPPAARLALMRAADRWADVWRSLTQLVLGTIMITDARRQALCRTYFARHPEYRRAAP
jgi:cytochrome P450